MFDKKYASGYYTVVGGNLVTWRRKKQKMVAGSTIEVKGHGPYFLWDDIGPSFIVVVYTTLETMHYDK